MGEQMKGKPHSLSARLAGNIVDFEAVARHEEASGRANDPAMRRVIAAGRAMAREAGPLTEAVEVCVTALTGSRGAESPYFLRKVRVIERRAKVLRFPGDHDPQEAA